MSLYYNLPEPADPISDESDWEGDEDERLNPGESGNYEDSESDYSTYSKFFGEIPDTINGEYTKVKELGSGEFGTVLHVVHIKTKKDLAMKVFHKAMDSDSGRKEALSEVEILKKINEFEPERNFCLKISSDFETQIRNKSRLCATFDLHGHSLAKLISDLRKNKFTLRMSQVRSIAFQLLHGAAFLHGHSMIHGDIKPANILLKNRGLKFCYPKNRRYQALDENSIVIIRNTEIRYADFGMTVNISDPETVKDQENPPGSPMYNAPEKLARREWSFACDVFSIGLLVLELYRDHPYARVHSSRHRWAMLEKLLGKIPAEYRNRIDFDENGFVKKEFRDKPEESLKDLADLKPLEEWFTADRKDPDRKDKKQLCDLLKKLLCLNKELRIKAIDALNHEFFDKTYDRHPSWKGRVLRALGL